jgi:hypothetical protein
MYSRCDMRKAPERPATQSELMEKPWLELTGW